MFQISRKTSKQLEPAPIPANSLLTSSTLSDQQKSNSVTPGSSRRSSRSRETVLSRSKISSYSSEKQLEFIHSWEANISSLDPQNNNTELWGPDFATEYSNVSLHWKSCITATQEESDNSTHPSTAIKCFVGYKFGPWANIKAEFETKIQKPDGTWSKSSNKAALWVLQGVSRGVVDLLPQEICNFQPGDLIFSDNPVKVLIVLKIGEIYFDPIRAIDSVLERQLEKESNDDDDEDYMEQCFFGPAYKFVVADFSDPEAESDFKVIAGKTGRKFHCHKFVFRQKIPEFCRTFFNKPLEENCLVLEKFNPDVINEVLFFMYKDRISVKFSKFALEILDLAEILKFKALKKICEPELVKLLNQKNVEILVKKAHSNQLVVLKSECEKLMVELITKENAPKYFDIAASLELEVLKNVASNVIASNYKVVSKNKVEDTSKELWSDVYDLMADRLQAYHCL